MDWDILDKLESFGQKVKVWDVPGHIWRIKDMLLHPRQFWQEYEIMPIKDKLVQFVTYAALFALAIWVAADDSLSIADLVKIMVMEVATLFVFVAILYIANSSVKKDWKGFLFYVVFCCYVKFICIIPQVISLKAYYQSGAPLLIGVAALISITTELIILIYPAYICQYSKKNVILAILISVLLLNIYDSFYIITGFSRPSNSNFENVVARERYELGKSIKNAYDIPSFAISSERNKDIWYLYSNPTDSVASLKFNDKARFLKDLTEDIDSLKSLSDRCRFKTNRDFFNEMYQLKKGILYVHETRSYENSPVCKQVDVMKDSVIVDRIYYRVFNREIEEANARLMRQDIKESEQFEMAFSTFYIGALWHPVLFVKQLYDNK